MGRTQHTLKGRIYIMKLFEYGKNGVTLNILVFMIYTAY